MMMAHLQEHSLLVDSVGTGLVTWKNYTKRSKDKKEMEAALAKYEDTAKYETVSTYRTLKIV